MWCKLTPYLAIHCFLYDMCGNFRSTENSIARLILMEFSYNYSISFLILFLVQKLTFRRLGKSHKSLSCTLLSCLTTLTFHTLESRFTVEIIKLQNCLEQSVPESVVKFLPSELHLCINFLTTNAEMVLIL